MASVKDMHDWGIDTKNCRLISYDDYEKLVRADCKPLLNDVLIAKDGSHLNMNCNFIESLIYNKGFISNDVHSRFLLITFCLALPPGTVRSGRRQHSWRYWVSLMGQSTSSRSPGFQVLSNHGSNGP